MTSSSLASQAIIRLDEQQQQSSPPRECRAGPPGLSGTAISSHLGAIERSQTAANSMWSKGAAYF